MSQRVRESSSTGRDDSTGGAHMRIGPVATVKRRRVHRRRVPRFCDLSGGARRCGTYRRAHKWRRKRLIGAESDVMTRAVTRCVPFRPQRLGNIHSALACTPSPRNPRSECKTSEPSQPSRSSVADKSYMCRYSISGRLLHHVYSLNHRPLLLRSPPSQGLVSYSVGS